MIVTFKKKGKTSPKVGDVVKLRGVLKSEEPKLHRVSEVTFAGVGEPRICSVHPIYGESWYATDEQEELATLLGFDCYDDLWDFCNKKYKIRENEDLVIEIIKYDEQDDRI